MDKILGNKRNIFIFMFPATLFFLMFYFFPIFMTGGLSLTQWNGYMMPEFIGVKNFTKLFHDQVFYTGLKNTAFILFFQLVVQIPITVILALILNTCTRGVKFYKSSFFVPVIFSATAVGLLWMRIYDTDHGLVNRVFDIFGLHHQAWLSDGKTAIFALIATMIWRSIGYYLIILYAGVKSIPRDYYEAALIDGCNTVQSDLHITIPLMRNAINVCVVLSAVNALREYPLIYVMTAGGPYNSTSTPAIQMFQESFLKMNFGYGSSIAVILVVECLLVSFIINKAFPESDLQY